MKILSIILSVILLFGTLNTAFSQTVSSTEQCKTVMHEKIGPKKYPNGMVKLEKSLVPIKICKSIDNPTIKKPKPKPDEPNTDPTCQLRTKAQCEYWKNWQERVKKNPLLKVDRALLNDMKATVDQIAVHILVKGAIDDFRPLILQENQSQCPNLLKSREI